VPRFSNTLPTSQEKEPSWLILILVDCLLLLNPSRSWLD
jgi:hypothetical protein